MRAAMLAGGAMAAAVLVLCAQAPAADPLLQALLRQKRSVKWWTRKAS